MWRHVVRKQGQRRFFAGLPQLLTRLLPKREFLARIVSEGGSAMVIVNLPGDVNMGDVVKPETLRLLADLGLELGLEVFPAMK